MSTSGMVKWLPIVAAALAACQGAPTDAERNHGSDYLIAFQQGQLVIGKVLYACNKWSDEVPSSSRITVDLSLIRTAAVPSTTGPTEEELEVIRDLDGKVIHLFNMSEVRTDLPVDAVPKLVGYWGETNQRIANHARAVPQPDRVDLQVSVGYEGDPDPVMKRFVQFGGVVTNHLDKSGAFLGVISDSAVPEFLSDGGVRFIDQTSYLCMDSGI